MKFHKCIVYASKQVEDNGITLPRRDLKPTARSVHLAEASVHSIGTCDRFSKPCAKLPRPSHMVFSSFSKWPSKLGVLLCCRLWPVVTQPFPGSLSGYFSLSKQKAGTPHQNQGRKATYLTCTSAIYRVPLGSVRTFVPRPMCWCSSESQCRGGGGG